MSESVTRDRKLQPFWSGTEFLDWESANCCRCALYSETETQPYVWGECPFHDALSEASVGDGLVDAELAARYGCTLEVVERGRPWPCSRRVPVPDEMDAICEAWQGHRKSEETPLTAEDVRRIAFLATQPPLTPDDVRHIAREEVNAALVRLAAKRERQERLERLEAV